MDKDMGNLPLRGLDRTIWGDAKLTPDLITIKRGRESDMLSQFFILRVLPLFHRLIGRHFKARNLPSINFVE
jgi:hypothetical protein